jgi:hypothetical protein
MGAGGTETGLMRLRNTSDASDVATSNSLYTYSGGTNPTQEAHIDTKFTIASAKTFEFQDYRTFGYIAGFGAAANIPGYSEKYLTCVIEKLS